IRDDLVTGVQTCALPICQLRPGTMAALREGARAYAGDLIVARQNDNHLEAGEPGRTLANGDLLRVEALGEHHLTVSRLIRSGRRSEERRVGKRVGSRREP